MKNKKPVIRIYKWGKKYFYFDVTAMGDIVKSMDVWSQNMQVYLYCKEVFPK